MIEIISYEKVEKGSLKEKVSVRIKKWGNFCIYDIAIMQKDNNRWISFPSKKVLIGTESKWLPCMSFDDPEMLKEFTKKLLEVVDSEYK
jgi:DNA-binding cell septation regulator SpoVG